MRMPNSRVADCIRLFLLWNPLKSIIHQAERTPMHILHAIYFPAGFPTWRWGIQQMQTRSEQQRPHWTVKERRRSNASPFSEETIDFADLIPLLFATPILNGCLVTEYLQREERHQWQT